MTETYQILGPRGSAMAGKGVVGLAARFDPQPVRRVEGHFEPESGVRLYRCEWWPEPAATLPSRLPALVLVHGFAEHCRRYDELAAHLVRQGIGVCRFDARGHGRSSGQRGYVRRFDEYVSDLRAYVALLTAEQPGHGLALLGHSQGALVAVRALQRELTGIAALVLTNPYLRLREERRPVPDGLARLLSLVAGRLPLPNGLRSQDLTHDLTLQKAHARDRWNHRVATPRWYWSALEAGRAALADAPRLTLPLLLIVGDADPIAEPGAMLELYERALSQDKQLVLRRGELHEVLNETDRESAYELIASWLKQRSPV
jgi:acylglycerol lipase